MKITVSDGETTASVEWPVLPSVTPEEALVSLIRAHTERRLCEEIEVTAETVLSTAPEPADDGFKFRVGQRVRVIADTNSNGCKWKTGTVTARSPIGGFSASHVSYHIDSAWTVIRECDLEPAEEP